MFRRWRSAEENSPLPGGEDDVGKKTADERAPVYFYSRHPPSSLSLSLPLSDSERITSYLADDGGNYRLRVREPAAVKLVLRIVTS